MPRPTIVGAFWKARVEIRRLIGFATSKENLFEVSNRKHEPNFNFVYEIYNSDPPTDM